MVPLVVIRPEPGCSASLAAARAVRLEAHGFPLFEVVAKSWEAPISGYFDAILGGSANAFRLGGKGLSVLRDLPVYAVGVTTAAAAHEAGFSVTATGNGGLQGMLADLDPVHRRLLRLAGDERVPLNLPKGVTMEERVVYASVPRAMPPDLASLLRAPAMIALHSAEAARHLAAQCVTNGIRRSLLRLIALSPRIASAAGEGWGEVATASLPNDKALLALALQMCQDPGPRGRD
ncbi:uroporphyrinogen-III synthase [Novosphingobium sp.]|uniref:uroporphyrinogen-III synthase n=1 Tax=Novosphingobium sp. TaxID=1874826 RepID=UPI0025CF1E91|nr:uroporphyrinogen-III synthase [Novosphingobium sp.]